MKWTWLAEMPSTNARSAATLLLALATGVRVVGAGWEPPDNWLYFLAALGGIDALQFTAKRATYKAEAV